MESKPTRRFTRLLTSLALCSLTTAVVEAATVTESTPLHLRPDPGAPVIGTLPADAEYTPVPPAELAAAGITKSSPGWVGLRHAGPFFGFADNQSVGKDLVLHPGAEVHAAPDQESPVIHTVGQEEKVEVVEPSAGWVKVVFRNDQLVFLQTNNPAPTEATAAPDAAPAPVSNAPAVVPPDPDATTPQLIRGYLLDARPVWRSGHKYDYQLVDEDNQRLALLDFSALLESEPIANFKNRMVEIYGSRVAAPDVKDLVFRAETLALAGATGQ